VTNQIKAGEMQGAKPTYRFSWSAIINWAMTHNNPET
jgi:hypothetical protein